MNEFTVQISSSYFCAGIIIRDSICVIAAPIVKWMVGKKRNYLRKYCLKKGWNFYILPREK